jgi:hypothetical protein
VDPHQDSFIGGRKELRKNTSAGVTEQRPGKSNLNPRPRPETSKGPTQADPNWVRQQQQQQEEATREQTRQKQLEGQRQREQALQQQQEESRREQTRQKQLEGQRQRERALQQQQEETRREQARQQQLSLVLLCRLLQQPQPQQQLHRQYIVHYLLWRQFR